MKLIPLALAGLLLGGCADTIAVMGHCELPEKLAKKIDPLPDRTGPLSHDDQTKAWAEDRGAGAKAIAHNNELIDYVQEKCQ